MADMEVNNENEPKEDAQATTETEKGISSGSDRVLRSEGETTVDDNIEGKKEVRVDEKGKGKMPMEIDVKGKRKMPMEDEIANRYSSTDSSGYYGEGYCYTSESSSDDDEDGKQSVTPWVGFTLHKHFNSPKLGGQETGKRNVTTEEAENTSIRRKERGAIEKEKLVLGGSGKSLSARAESKYNEMASGNKRVDGSNANENVKGKESTAGGTTM